MEGLEGCEGLLLFLFIPYAAFVWYTHYSYAMSASEMIVQGRDRKLLLITPLICAIGLFLVLILWGDPYVRSDGFYLLFYWSWGMAWTAMAKWIFPYLGFSIMDDGLERRNTPATIAICGALIGLTIAFAGGNVGEGPGWWIVLLSACTSVGAFFLAWFVLEFFTQVSETVTIERNMAAGIRLGVLLILIGFLLGRAVSGNWIDMEDFINSFVMRAWYVIPLLIIAIGFEWMGRPSERDPNPSSILYGAVPSVAYAVVSVMAVILYNRSIPR